MTTIYMRPTKKDETVKLSDGSQAVVDVIKAPDGPCYQFRFNEHAHANFWCQQPVKDGQVIKVASINGPEKFQIQLR
ncbi:MAG TPA: hypothetical protein DDW71_04460 [Lactobacillus sp.]|jgi:hypothetical protein|uniref:Uncharacterized protein n=1 Tax=Secundilactobacillus silagincola TaxID=1714681 RepID=A0A1Z5J0Y6_9LACO|nr:hypothetical protein [Secundilactobacillus silagincola]GAX07438.1 hypothetical protein IWT5_00171 [Secundilactobacillus silagincola]HBF74489.1 hypothetical protein [Lactobacillus sp.]